MVHLPRRALADTQPDQLVVGPKGPVEEHQVGASETGQQGVVDAAAARDEGARATGALIRHDQPHRVPDLVLAREPRRPGGHGKAGDAKSARGSVAIAQAQGPVRYQLGDHHLGKGPRDGQDPGVILEDAPDRVGGRRSWTSSAPSSPHTGTKSTSNVRRCSCDKARKKRLMTAGRSRDSLPPSASRRTRLSRNQRAPSALTAAED